MAGHWLSLVDYANKYKVSISTLRRKIKLDDIPFRLQSGKYYLVDEPLDLIGAAQGSQLELDKPKNFKTEPETAIRTIPQENGDSVLVAANRLVDEIKKAYTLILQEKDEQIRQYRDEISDLKTLVRVLEGENDRIQRSNNKDNLYFE